MAENSSENVNRIFVGGLGANVTSNDLKNIFTSLGKVKNVEFVRTNGRDFAYVDFEPQSDKALHKLFSTYNGCKWKGGKLRLEKAKEHYLTRLKREWAQDSVPVPEPVQEVEPVPVDPKLEKLNLDSMKINIFFPKLMKVKSLPYKGSGKHKYSFQRVELSSTLPLHFCDCELHCGSHASVDEIYNDALESAAREKELSVMHSVLERLMRENEERENEERESHGRESHGREDEERESEGGNEERESEERECEEGESEERESEDDGDMVMNISSRRSEELMLERVLKESLDSKKELQERKRKVSKAKIIEKQAEETCKNENEERENEERESEEREEIEEEEESDGDIVLNISSNKSDDLMLEHILKENLDNKTGSQKKKHKVSKDKIIKKQNENEEKEKVKEELDGDMIINISDNKPDELILEPIVEEALDNNKQNDISEEENIQNQAQEDSVNIEEKEEKSSLINVEKNTTENELKENETKIQKPNSNSSNTWFQKSAWRDLVGSSNTSLFSSSTSIQTLNSNLPKQANNSNEPSKKPKEPQITQQTQNPIIPKQVTNSNEDSKKRKEISKEGENVNKKIRRVVQKVTVSEVCPFMRSEESEKEWIKTRNALKGYMKNNKKKSDGSNKMRGKRGN